MSSPLTPKQWFVMIFVNVIISAVTTLLIVRVVTNQTGIRQVNAPSTTQQEVATLVVVRSPTSTPTTPTATLVPVAQVVSKPSNTPTKPSPTNTATPLPAVEVAPSPTRAPTSRSPGIVGISTVLYANQRIKESVIIYSQGNDTNLKGWTISSSRSISYTFGDVTVPKDSFISLHTTSGVDVLTDVFMNRTTAAWQVGDVITLSNKGVIVAKATVRLQ